LIACLALSPARAAGGPDAEEVELELAGVMAVGGDGACLLVLREKGARTLLPLLLPGVNAQTLGADLRARRTPGMLGEALRALGARVRDVQIGAAVETVSAARVRLRQGARLLEVPSRPSEAVALAHSAGAPIRATRRLLAEAGLTPEEIERARRRGPRTGEPLRL
jgi:bifunctional DNase/RNase